MLNEMINLFCTFAGAMENAELITLFFAVFTMGIAIGYAARSITMGKKIPKQLPI